MCQVERAGSIARSERIVSDQGPHKCDRTQARPCRTLKFCPGTFLFGYPPLAYHRRWGIFAMVFLETPVFTRQIKALVDDDRYLELQALLMAHPDAGDLIPGSGGLRKIRMRLAGRGRRAGGS